MTVYVLILILCDFGRFQFWPESDFCSTDFRNDHLKMNPDALIYPKSTLPTPGGANTFFGGGGWGAVVGGVVCQGARRKLSLWPVEGGLASSVVPPPASPMLVAMNLFALPFC